MRTPGKIARLFILIFLLIAASTLIASPSRVYRADTRPPDGASGIFSTGFHPWGENDNLAQHVLGFSLGEENQFGSAFVATTADFEFATGPFFAEGRTGFWVYEIRPTNNFYSVVLSFEHYVQTDDYYQELLSDYRHQAEYAALGGIAREQIIRATYYSVENGRAVPGVSEANSSYVPDSTAANDSYYPGAGVVANPRSPILLCANNTHFDSASNLVDSADSLTFEEKLMRCYRRFSSVAPISVLLFGSE